MMPRMRPTFRLDPTDEYIAKRASLTGKRLQAVVWAEEGITDDPDHNHWRRVTTRGTILDFEAADVGLMIEYKAPVDSVVRLVDVIDLRERR